MSLKLTNISDLPATELAHSFCDLGLLDAQLEFLMARWWLNSKDQHLSWQDFINSFVNYELEFNPQYLEFFKNIVPENLKITKNKIRLDHKLIIETILKYSLIDKKKFCLTALRLMNDIYEFENRLLTKRNEQGKYLDFSVYRSFDSLDKIFGIDYQLDQSICFKKTEERIYSGAGIGVQSSYSTFLTALHFLQLPFGAKVVDLGSGYGRLGFIIGLIRPDIQFTGYEFVKERVLQSQQIVRNFELSKSVCFLEQDLSQTDFKLPFANLYYMYDPFSESTYQKIFTEIEDLASSKKVQIVTKGNANFKIQQFFMNRSWFKVADFHSGNLCVYCNV